MFDTRKSIATRLNDTADLLIDFATLGEYGLEPVGRTARACEADRRPPVTRQSRRPGSVSTFATVAPDSPYYDILHGPRGPRRNAARKRGVRDASMTVRASGAA
jgi:hypothetical protein